MVLVKSISLLSRDARCDGFVFRWKCAEVNLSNVHRDLGAVASVTVLINAMWPLLLFLKSGRFLLFSWRVTSRRLF